MRDSILVQHQTVFHLHSSDLSQDGFSSYLADDHSAINLPNPVIADMGHPQQITVTVQPGDTLNHEGN